MNDPNNAAPPRPEIGDVVTLELDGWAHGGEAVGRLPIGMAVFVAYAIPGEKVTARITQRRKRWARADLVEVVEPSVHRVTPPCPYYGPDACGGCQLQHIAPDHQLALKARVLTEQLGRIGRIDNPPVAGVEPVTGAWPDRYRGWARMAVAPNGRLGFRQSGSNRVEAVDECLLMNQDLAGLRAAAGESWQGAEEVGLMAGTDGAMLTLHPGDGGLPAAPDGDFGVAIQGINGPQVIRGPGEVTMQVGDRALRVSAGAFFQAGPATATALATAVVEAADVGPEDRVWDLYAGIGLFSGVLADRAASVIAVESNTAAVADARHNLADSGAEVFPGDVADVINDLDGVDVIVLDPPRAGAGAEVCAAIIRSRPRRVVYVACDPAALARDARTLVDGGLALVSVRGIDTFGHTAHVEAIAVFEGESLE